ncbi:MAG TPA: ABC transporter substrate-binding protein [Acidimicrobiia bacterium]|nr:ABC transporter substrate-binding protein [Acidimicrobiia bacterium]
MQAGGSETSESTSPVSPGADAASGGQSTVPAGGGPAGSARPASGSAGERGSAAPASAAGDVPPSRPAAAPSPAPAGSTPDAGRSGSSATPPSPPAPPAPPAKAAAPIRLGGVFPLSGPLGSVGTAMMQGIQAILTQANESGGVAGAALELRIEDDQFDPVRGKALVQKLINEDKVFALAGIFSPFTTQAALPDIRAAGVPLVSPSGSDDREFDEPLLYPVTNPCGRQMAGNVQHLIQSVRRSKLAVVYLNVEAVSNCVKQFSAVARKLGGEIVFESATAPAAPDCASRILSARASGADALVVIVDNLGVVKCVQAQKQQGWSVPVSISYNIVDDPTLLDGLGKAAEGLLSSSPFSGGSSPAFDEQCGAIRRYYPKAKVQFFMLVGCTGAKLLVEGLRAAGPGASRVALQAVLDSGRVFSFGGLLPDLSYRPGRHLPYDLTATVEVRGGKWVRTGRLYTPVAP